MKYYYSEKETADFLKTKNKRAYLYGSFVGYNNFGDIIQLKHAIDFHKQRTDLTPVIVLHLTSLESSHHVQELKRWYGCDHFIFISDKVFNTTDANLALIKKIQPGGLLHIYGGGFLNKYWGRGIIEKVIDMLDSLAISNYLFSGQQVEEATVPYLNKLIEKQQPLLFGVRDYESYKYMKQAGVAKNIEFSFDDVIEILHTWRESTRPSLKLRLLNKMRPTTTLWHINISSYATANKKRVLEKIRRVKRDRPKNRVLVAHAYNDIRVSLRDSLQSILQLENDFPYYDYKVVNLAQMALDIHPEKNTYPNIAALLSNVDLAVASSYHTAMLTTIFGIPSFLMSENEFYSQKQKGLGFGNDFGKFMDDPSKHLNSFQKEMIERQEWLEKLEKTVKKTTKVKDGKIVAMQTGLDMKQAPELQYRGSNS